MKVLWVLGFVLLLMLKIVLLPVRALLGFLGLSLDFVGAIVCNIAGLFGTIFLFIVVISRLCGDVTNAVFLEGFIFAVLVAVIPRALYYVGRRLILGLQALLSRI
jgi:hypothetical protein